MPPKASQRRIATAPGQSRTKPSRNGKEPEFASGADLELPYGIATLPRLGKRVYVRTLDALDVMELEVLPDLAEYLEKVRAVQARLAGAGEDAEEREAIVAEVKESDDAMSITEKRHNARLYAGWLADVLHISVLQSPKMLSAEECADPDCKVEGRRHPPALWTTRQCRRLVNTGDDDAIFAVAMSGQQYGRMLPFSSDETPSATPQPAGTGE